MSEMKTTIEKYAAMLPMSKSLSVTDAEKRAGDFLSICAQVTDWRHMLSQEKIKLTSVQTSVYAEQMSKGTAKTVTENKLTAEASAEYTSAREDLETIENDLSYLKAYYDIFMAAHVFYRNVAKGEQF